MTVPDLVTLQPTCGLYPAVSSGLTTVLNGSRRGGSGVAIVSPTPEGLSRHDRL